MNRLTQHISLILISSSLILHGCDRPVPQKSGVQQRPIPGGRPDGKHYAGGVGDFSDDTAEDVPPEEQAAEGQTGTSGSHTSSSHTSYHGGYHPRSRVFVPLPIPLGGSRGVTSSPGPSTGFQSGRPTSGSSRPSGSSSVGSSSRGGFGSSSHGVAS